MNIDLYVPARSTSGRPGELCVTAADAGWSRAGLQVLTLGPGETRTVRTGSTEGALVPLEGSLTVRCDGEPFTLAGRPDVFSMVSDFLYVPLDAHLELSSEGGCRVALATARAQRKLAPAYCRAADVPVEIRGAGSASRQINNLMTPESFPADRLMVVEVLTPAGNWSSYPPHKHDHEGPCEAAVEEIYYFEVARGATNRGGAPRSLGEGWAYHHVYGPDGTARFCGPVAHGDVVLVPAGYHGPSQAPPGYDLYYLNVLAGDGATRSMACSDDPALAWVRASWVDDLPDPRLPMAHPPSEAPPGTLGPLREMPAS